MTVAGQTAVTYGYDDAHRLIGYAGNSKPAGFTTPIGGPLDIPEQHRCLHAATMRQLAGVSYASATTLGSNMRRKCGWQSCDGRWSWVARACRRLGGATCARTALQPGRRVVYLRPNGNLASDGTLLYLERAESTGHDQRGSSASFAYDGTGRRRAKTVSSVRRASRRRESRSGTVRRIAIGQSARRNRHRRNPDQTDIGGARMLLAGALVDGRARHKRRPADDLPERRSGRRRRAAHRAATP